MPFYFPSFFCLLLLLVLSLSISPPPPPPTTSLFPGRSSLFPFEDGFLDDGHGDPSLTPGLNSPTRCQNGERMERYSRKVFVGGLPPDIDEGTDGRQWHLPVCQICLGCLVSPYGHWPRACITSLRWPISHTHTHTWKLARAHNQIFTLLYNHYISS